MSCATVGAYLGSFHELGPHAEGASLHSGTLEGRTVGARACVADGITELQEFSKPRDILRF